MKKWLGIIPLLGLLSSVWGCAPAISKKVMQEVDPAVSFESVFQSPETYRGKTVLWGGKIIKTKNLKDGTLIEILQKKIDYWKQPSKKDVSAGRFLALYEGYLDGAIYAAGRNVTVAGVVKGRKTQPLDELDYSYPLIVIREIHLWPVARKVHHNHHHGIFFHRYYYGPYWRHW